MQIAYVRGLVVGVKTLEESGALIVNAYSQAVKGGNWIVKRLRMDRSAFTAQSTTLDRQGVNKSVGGYWYSKD